MKLLLITLVLCASLALCESGLSERYKDNDESDEELMASVMKPLTNAYKYTGFVRSPMTGSRNSRRNNHYHQKKLAGLRKMIQQGYEDWVEFKEKYGKVYESDEEESRRFLAFLRNLEIVRKNNINYKRKIVSFKLGLNHLSDMSHQEYQKLNGLRFNGNRMNGSKFLEPHYADVPAQVDWRTKGYVTDVKNQEQCGSCWAFSATGSLEGQHMRATGNLVSLSEQNLVDCSGEDCGGGSMDDAFKYIKTNGGIDTEASYPYTGTDGQCEFKKSTVGAVDTGFVDLPSGDEDKLKVAVATQGPISIAIDASQDSFQSYSSGVYYEPNCKSDLEDLDHGVLIVGYGTDTEGGDYWLVKNSWGEDWGDKGYIMMSRNKDNNCGIATAASYPLV